jgi:hypothetical protein
MADLLLRPLLLLFAVHAAAGPDGGVDSQVGCFGILQMMVHWLSEARLFKQCEQWQRFVLVMVNNRC